MGVALKICFGAGAACHDRSTFRMRSGCVSEHFSVRTLDQVLNGCGRYCKVPQEFPSVHSWPPLSLVGVTVAVCISEICQDIGEIQCRNHRPLVLTGSVRFVRSSLLDFKVLGGSYSQKV